MYNAYTAVWLAWNAIFKIIGLRWEMLTSFESGTRRSVRMISARCAKVNNSYVHDYVPTILHDYLLELDFTNLRLWHKRYLSPGSCSWNMTKSMDSTCKHYVTTTRRVIFLKSIPINIINFMTWTATIVLEKNVYHGRYAFALHVSHEAAERVRYR